MELNNIIKLKDTINTHFKKINDLIEPEIPSLFFEISSEYKESENAIVCHCSPKYKLHKQLYYINIKDNTYAELGNGVKYVDSNIICNDNKWDKIEDDTIMYIWGIYCPIVILEFIHNTLSESYKKLKKNGKIIFPDYIESYHLDDLYNNTQFNNFTFTLVPIDKFPYIINKKSLLNIKQFFVFTKN
jgi:hypothetical protein